MSDNRRAALPNLSFTALLFTVFLVLKLTGVIDWSWWWVTAPLWIPLAMTVAIAPFALLAAYSMAVGGRR